MALSRTQKILKYLTTYEISAPDRDYSDTPGKSGIEVDRLVNGLPCWIVDTAGGVTRPKKLIVTDWSWFYENDEQIKKDYKLFWEYLFNQGIECYVPVNAQIVLRVHNADELLQALRFADRIHPEKLATILSARGITRDEMVIVDYLRCKRLQKALNPVTQLIVPSDKFKLNQFIHLPPDELLMLLKTLPANEKIHISLDLRAAKANDRAQYLAYLSFILSNFKQIHTVDIKGTPARDELQNITNLLPDHAALNIEELPEVPPPPLTCGKLEAIKLNGHELNTRIFPLILEQLSRSARENFHIGFSYIQSPVTNLSGYGLWKKIAKLEMEQCANENMRSILNDCTAVKELNLLSHDLEFVNGLTNNLPHLEKITVQASTIHTNDLITLLKLAPNAKWLSLTGFGEISGHVISHYLSQLTYLKLVSVIFSEENFVIPKSTTLEKLELSKCTASGDQLAELFARSPNLSELAISSHTNFNTMSQRADLKNHPLLKQLKVLTLEPRENSDSLNQLLLWAPNIEQLDLFASGVYAKLLQNLDNSIQLNRLGSLRWRSGDSAAALLSLLHKCPNLQCMVINLNGPIPPEAVRPGALAHLEEASISLQGHAQLHNVAGLFAACPNIKKLKLSGTVFPTNILLQLSKLEKLTHLDISNCWLSAEEFTTLLDHYPNLTSLTIHSRSPDIESYLKKISSLEGSKLKTIELTGGRWEAARAASWKSENPRIYMPSLSISGVESEEDDNTSLANLINKFDFDFLNFFKPSENITADILGMIHFKPLQKVHIRHLLITPLQLRRLMEKGVRLQAAGSNNSVDAALLDESIDGSTVREVNPTVLDYLYIRTLRANDLDKVLANSPFLVSLSLSHLQGELPKTNYRCESLRELQVWYTFSGTANIINLIAHFPNLQVLRLPDLNIPGGDLVRILSSASRLHTVDLPNISDDLLYNIRILFPHLKIIHRKDDSPAARQNQDIKQDNPAVRDRWMQKAFPTAPAMTGVPNWSSVYESNPLDNWTKTPQVYSRQLFAYKQGNHPSPHHYRLQVFNDLSLGINVKPLITGTVRPVPAPAQSPAPLSELYKTSFQQQPDCYYGVLKLPMEDWTPLPSLSTREEILALTASVPVELGYCAEQALYYVRPKVPTSQPITVSFILKSEAVRDFPQNVTVPELDFSQIRFKYDGTSSIDAQLKERFAKLPRLEKIAALKKFCESFEDSELANPPFHGIDILNARIAERRGVCRHRSIAFMALAKALKNELAADGITVRSVKNDCHQYIETTVDNTSYRVDLGGGLAEEERFQMKKEKPMDTTLTPPAETDAPLPAKNNPFCAWDTIKSQAKDWQAYCAELMQAARGLLPGERNILVALDDNDVEAFHHHMTAYLKSQQHRSFYLSSLDDAQEKQAKVLDGQLVTAPSRLTDFVTHADNGDMLISDWSDYRARHVGLNTLFDDERKFKSHPVHPELSLITVMKKSSLEKMGEDFYSRYRGVSEAPSLPPHWDLQQLLATTPGYTSDWQKAEFFDNNWQNTLLGRVNVQEKQFISQEGPLIKAIKQKKPGILLQNAPWHKQEFRLFMAELLQKREIYHNGERLTLPENFLIKSVDTPYVLQSPNLRLANETQRAPDFLLNAQNFKSFVNNIQCKDGAIFNAHGFLEQNAEKEINLCVTENIPANQWAQLISLANEYKVTINLTLARNVTLPAEMGSGRELLPPLIKTTGQVKLITSNDLDRAEEFIFKEAPQSIIINIHAGTEFTDLIERPVKSSGDKDPLAFQSLISDCWKKLMAGETIILKGKLSEKLARQLETLFLEPPYLWVNGEKQFPKGRLFIIADKNPSSIITEEQRNFTRDEIWQAIRERNQDNPQFKKFIQAHDAFTQKNPGVDFSYAQLRDMTDKLRTRKDTNPFRSYYRLNPDDPALAASKEIWAKQPKGAKQPALLARHAKITAELAATPYLFITGPSGVGKSTYVLSQLQNEKQDVKVGMDNIKKWLAEGGILFIDEANLERAGSWEILEGLFNRKPAKPGILHEGVYYPLNDRHKVIFAGNYSHFAGRVQDDFFARHGQVFNFKELPDDVLDNEIIRPALKNLRPGLLKMAADAIVTTMIENYHKINSLSDNHPFTPRNLKIITLRFYDYIKTGKDYNTPLQLAIRDEARGLLTPEQQQHFPEWKQLDEPVKQLNHALPYKTGNFILTESRRDHFRLLVTQLNLRETSISDARASDFEIPGVLIEGPPGVGKSLMVKEHLRATGFVEVKIDKPKPENISTDKYFYCLTPTDPEIMKKTLIEAFHNGAVVVVDEINSLVMERLMNQLLSGRDPDGKKTSKKGFMIIGTQNPVSYSGRQVLSMAFENRFLKMNISDYPDTELAKIVLEKCKENKYPTPEHYTGMLMNHYLEASRYARKNNKMPPPTPRDLFALVRQKEKVMNLYKHGEHPPLGLFAHAPAHSAQPAVTPRP